MHVYEPTVWAGCFQLQITESHICLTKRKIWGLTIEVSFSYDQNQALHILILKQHSLSLPDSFGLLYSWVLQDGPRRLQADAVEAFTLSRKQTLFLLITEQALVSSDQATSCSTCEPTFQFDRWYSVAGLAKVLCTLLDMEVQPAPLSQQVRSPEGDDAERTQGQLSFKGPGHSRCQFYLLDAYEILMNSLNQVIDSVMSTSSIFFSLFAVNYVDILYT